MQWEYFCGDFFFPFIFDLARTVSVLFGLFSISWILSLGGLVGLHQTDLELFEKTDLWLNYGTFLVLGVSFIFRIGLPIVSKGSNE
jgi:hypothetical protein